MQLFLGGYSQYLQYTFTMNYILCIVFCLTASDTLQEGGEERTFNVIVVLSSTYVVSFCDTYLNKSFFLDNNVSRPGRYFLCFKSLEPLGKL